MAFLAALEASPLGVWVVESVWLHPIMLCFHALGMAVVVGIVLVLDLRVLGYAKGLSVARFERLLSIAWAGFAVNAVSGLVIFAGNATRLIGNWTFLLKMALIVLGGLSVWALWRMLKAEPEQMGPDGVASVRAKALALASLIFWIGAIVAGRYIAYTLLAALQAEYQ